MASSRRKGLHEMPPYERTAEDLPPGETPAHTGAGAGPGVAPEIEEKAQRGGFEEAWLIQKSREIYTTSTDYLDANITNTWEKNLSHFHSQHAPGSKYRAQNYKRTRIFRPKTRSIMKSSEAAVGMALFATTDRAIVEAENPRDNAQVVSAKLNKAILQYRLSKRLKWFQTCLGAYQSTKVYGICVSHQYWRYEVDTEVRPSKNEDGSLVVDDEGWPLGTTEKVVRHDELVIDLIPPENFRFEPMSDWRDPVGTSPYLIYMIPMSAGEARERMHTVDPKTGRPEWHEHSLDAILATRRQSYSRTRQAREGRERIDAADQQRGNEYTTVWAHMNVVRIKGEDYVWWTMGTELLLTDPVPLYQLYPHLKRGERPFVMGFSAIEAFRNYPAGDVEQMSGLQEETNLVTNQRLDNVKLVLNKRYYVKRGANVDIEALMRNVPGGGVMMNDTEKDVKTVETNDVTSSSYQEQDRLAVEIDDLVGTFSPSSVQSNRQLNQTVGGMNQLSQTAGAVQDYGIQVFVETWAEPVLYQCVKLIQMYETDEVILTHAREEVQLWQRFGIDKITDELLRQELSVNVDVGIGNTDPVRRVERLIYGVNQAIAIPGMIERVKPLKIADEIFGSLGYRDASRFFLSDTELEEKMQAQPPQENPEIVLKRQELEIRREDNQLRDQRERDKMETDYHLNVQRLALEAETTVAELENRMRAEGLRSQTQRDVAALKGRNESRKLSLAVARGGDGGKQGESA